MALLERVATLIRANLNELIERAEEPEKMLRQVMLDMQNQLMQVKTQVAIAIADQHLLKKRLKEQEDKAAEWVRKAEMAVARKQDDLARAALDRSLNCRSSADSLRRHTEEQTVQVENLKSALRKLAEKFTEAQLKNELLAAQNRRARAVNLTADAHLAVDEASAELNFDRMKNKVAATEAWSDAQSEMNAGSVEDRLASLEKQDEVERLLTELKTRKG